MTTTINPTTSGSATSVPLRITAGLWLIWGFVHAFAGIITMVSDTADAIDGIADKATVVGEYPDAAGAIINQHGWNLFWVGVVTMACVLFIWRGSMLAAALAAIVGGLTDIGYFLFLDLGGFVNFVPGTVMTIVSATAVGLTVWVWFSQRSTSGTASLR